MANLVARLRSPSRSREAPGWWEERRNGILIVLLTLVALLMGWSLKESALNATRQVALGGLLPAVSYPADWIVERQEGLLLRAANPRSASAFDARIEVYTRDVRENETLDSLSASWPLRRGQDLAFYRILSTQTLSGPQGQPALLFTYAYVVDPSLPAGAPGLPVVVQAQDLVFIGNDGANNRLVVVTGVADATEWQAQAAVLHKVLQRMGVEGGAP